MKNRNKVIAVVAAVVVALAIAVPLIVVSRSNPSGPDAARCKTELSALITANNENHVPADVIDKQAPPQPCQGLSDDQLSTIVFELMGEEFDKATADVFGSETN